MKQGQGGEFGGVLGKLLGLLVLVAVVGGGWWWLFGRFALPDSEPSKPTKPTAVLDYAGRRDLGLDPFDAMVRPDPKTAREGSPERMPAYVRWFKEYTATVAACASWRAHNAITVGGLGGEQAAERGREAHLEYLYRAQLAEYYRAKWREADED